MAKKSKMDIDKSETDKIAAFMAREITLDRGTFASVLITEGWEVACKRDNIIVGRNQ